MAGNEVEVARFLLQNRGSITLKHLGVVTSIGAPLNAGGFQEVNTVSELNLISTQDSGKKADIYINGKGVSLKQAGASFPFNRLQRSELADVFKTVGFKDPQLQLAKIDAAIDRFHNKLVKKRDRPWQELFDEAEFKTLVKFLMTQGSPNLGFTRHPAEFILEAPKVGITEQNIHVFTFDEYFEIFKQNLFFALRRQWIGQLGGEHIRARGIAGKEGNQPWVYETISGQPRKCRDRGTRWREEISESDRRTVYFISVSKS